MSQLKADAGHRAAASHRANATKPKSKARLTIGSLRKALGVKDSDTKSMPTGNDFSAVYNFLVGLAAKFGIKKASKTPVFTSATPATMANPNPEHMLEFGRLIYDEGHQKSATDGVTNQQLMRVGWFLIGIAMEAGATGNDPASIYTSGDPLSKASAQGAWEMAQFLKSMAKVAALGFGKDGDVSGDMDEAATDLDTLNLGDLGPGDPSPTDDADNGTGDEPAEDKAELDELVKQLG